MAAKVNRPRKRSSKRRFYKRNGFWLTLLILGLVTAAVGFFVIESYTRPFRERAASYDLERINDLEIPSLILDRNGEEIGRIFVQNRSIIPISEVPQNLINALMAGEDSRFNSHGGVDYIGILRAVKLNLEKREINQGASTITQQLARNAYNLKKEAVERGESGIERKLVEAFLAMRIEKRYNKEEILDFYLNRIYFGSGFYGIRSASLGYFGKEPKELTISECASIVGLIKNPTKFSPLNNLKANEQTRNHVLERMVIEGTVTRSAAEEMKAKPVVLNPKPLQRGTTHLYERVAEAVGAALGEEALERGGFTIHTTILKEAQVAAEAALAKSLLEAESRPGYSHQKMVDYRRNPDGSPTFLQGAVLAVDHLTGEVLAHVGGRDYASVNYDFIVSGRRPLGTAFFPFIYAAALANGQSPASLVEDEPINNRALMVGGFEGIPGEFGMEVPSPVYEKMIPLRRSFEASKIAATVRLGGKIGLQKIIDAGVAFGLPMANAEVLPRLCVGWEPATLPQAVRAISGFARGGNLGAAQLIYVDRVVNPSGRVEYRRQPQPQPVVRAVDDATAWQVHSMMEGSLKRGSSAGVLDGLIAKPFAGAGKGGTTHDFADAWFLGYNKRITCGVWTGFLQGSNAIYPGAFSRDLAMPVWQATMNAVTPSFGAGEFTPPDSVVEVRICTHSGERATQFCQELEESVETGTVASKSTEVTDYFRKGTRELPFCSIHGGGLEGSGPETLSNDIALSRMPALDVTPVLPKSPVLIGNDPYHTELPSFLPTSEEEGFIRRRTNVLDSLDLGDTDIKIPLPRPKRMVIYED
jgi:membrane carboxypeptidase/penicillin-binding protein